MTLWEVCGIDCQVEVLNAATMLPPLFSAALACYTVKRKAWWRSNAGFLLICAWMIMIPFSTASHLYCAFNGRYSHILLRLDQTGISIASVLVGWALSKCQCFTFAMTFAAFCICGVMWLGPDYYREHVEWRTVTLAGMVLMYLSPMVWMRESFDESILPVMACFAAGFALAVFAPLGPYSHPLFHLILIPYTYYVSRSAMIFEHSQESRLLGADCEMSLEEGSCDEASSVGAWTSAAGTTGGEIRLQVSDCWNTSDSKDYECLVKDPELGELPYQEKYDS